MFLIITSLVILFNVIVNCHTAYCSVLHTQCLRIIRLH